jgi:hypothetical protein
MDFPVLLLHSEQWDYLLPITLECVWFVEGRLELAE